MRNLSLVMVALAATAMVVLGGALNLLFRGVFGNEEPYFLYLLAIGIGVTIGFVANHQKRPIAVILIAACSAVGCCLVGTYGVAVLERAAIADEFDAGAMRTDEFFIALEAYLAKYQVDASRPSFPDVANRLHYSDSEWTAAAKRWHEKTVDEQQSVRRKWRSQYVNLSRLGDERVANVFLASWNLRTYAIAAAIAGGIVLIIQQDRQRT
jgi:hypothetical protein